MKAPQLGIFSRLCMLLAAVSIAFVLLIAILLVQQRNLQQEDHAETIRNLTAVAHGVVAHYHELARGGKLSESEAQRQAMETLRSLRYQDSQYFFVHGVDYRTVMHPIKPETEGQDQTNQTDARGKHVIQDLVNLARDKGEGYVEYLWPHPGSTAAVAKLSYVKLFQPWGWVIGTGVYMDDVDVLFWQSVRRVTVWLVGVMVVIGLIAAWVMRGILRPVRMLREFSDVMAEIERNGDLSRSVTVTGNDEISTTGRAFNALLASLRESMRVVHGQIARVEGASSKVLDEIGSVRTSAARQSDEATSTSAAMEQLSASVTHIAEKTNETARTAGHANQEASAGEAQIQGLVEQMNRIAESVSSASRTIEALGVRSQEITNIVKTIKDIADQTNLLALNAAIEAARAGEQGRGFAVVADEVRKLAERSANATTEIGTMIESIQDETARVVASMRTGGELVQHGVGQVSQAGEAMSRIDRAVRDIVHLTEDVAASVRQQSSASQDVARSMERMVHMVEATDAAANVTHREAEAMQGTAAELRRAVGRFRC